MHCFFVLSPWVFASVILAGSNDVANAFGTSVGAKTLTLKQAVIIAIIFEFVGALVLGRVSTSTIAGGIANINVFLAEPEVRPARRVRGPTRLTHSGLGVPDPEKLRAGTRFTYGPMCPSRRSTLPTALPAPHCMNTGLLVRHDHCLDRGLRVASTGLLLGAQRVRDPLDHWVSLRVLAYLHCAPRPSSRPSTSRGTLWADVLDLAVWCDRHYVLFNQHVRPSASFPCSAIIGFSFVFGGANAVNWATPDSASFPPYKGVVPIVLAWFVSPVLTGLASCTIFLIVRTLVLRRENSYVLSFWVLPVMVMITTWIK